MVWQCWRKMSVTHGGDTRIDREGFIPNQGSSCLCCVGLGGSSSSAHQTAENVNINLKILISITLTCVHHATNAIGWQSLVHIQSWLGHKRHANGHKIIRILTLSLGRSFGLLLLVTSLVSNKHIFQTRTGTPTTSQCSHQAYITRKKKKIKPRRLL